MPEIPSHKICNCCKISKERSEFHPRRYRGRKGQFCETLRADCKACALQEANAYRQTDRGRMLEKLSAKRFCSTEHGKALRAKHMRIYRSKDENKLKNRIRKQLKYAIENGKITRPTVCAECLQESKRITAHHHKGYSKETALDIIWLCVPCHVRVEAQISSPDQCL